jgi:regulator of sirC expression with transglutaminase-like and TPR domain
MKGMDADGGCYGRVGQVCSLHSRPTHPLIYPSTHPSSAFICVLFMDFSLARQRFLQIARQPDELIDLEIAALYIAQEEYPDLEVAAVVQGLDRMAAAARAYLPSDPYPMKILQGINRYLYEDLGFVGNTQDYYEPQNSFLNDVLERRTGIPITLSLVYLAIARRVNFPMVGIGMPGHFLIRPAVDEMEIFVDPFHRGEILFLQDCADRLQQLYGRPVPMQPQFLAPVTPRQFLARLLTNLKMIYFNREDVPRALAAIERILLIFPDAPLELRDRGVLYFRLGRWGESRQDLMTYLDLVPGADDRPMVEQLLRRMELG